MYTCMGAYGGQRGHQIPEFEVFRQLWPPYQGLWEQNFSTPKEQKVFLST